MIVEKYIPKRVNKDVDPGAIGADGNRLFYPGDMLDCLNARYRSNNGRKFIVENVPGTLQKLFALPAGDNKCIGQFYWQKEASTIYCVYNSNGDHRVIEWKIDTNAFQVLLQGSSLNFSVDHYISQGGIIDNIWIFNDGNNRPRSVNLTRARAGGYVAPYSEYQLSLAAKPPISAPTFTFVTETSLLLNHVTRNTWQFSYRFVYLDNQRSTFSELSRVAWIRPYSKPEIKTNNAIDVTVNFPVYLAGLVKQIDIAYREGNTGNYFIFETVKNPTNNSYTVRFKNNGKSIAVSTEDQLRPFDYIPDQTHALEIVESRVFCPLNKTGFNVDESSFDLILSLSAETAEANPYNNKRYMKMGGSYSVGIIFKDDYGKRTFVKKVKEINVPFNDSNLGKLAGRSVLNWQLTGIPPAGFTSYQMVISRNRSQQTYFQCQTRGHLYISDITDKEEDDTRDFQTGIYFWQGKKFADPAFASQGTLDGAPYIYLEIPTNIPFIPNNSCLVRITFTAAGTVYAPEATYYAPVLDVVGNFIVIDLRYTQDSSGNPQSTKIAWNHRNVLFMEVFSPALSDDVIYYETGPVYNILSGGFETPSGTISGDTYMIVMTDEGKYQYVHSVNTGFGHVLDRNNPFVTESPSGIFSNTESQQIVVGSIGGGNVAVTDVEGKRIIYTIDYSKSSSDLGRPVTIFDEEKEQDLSTVFGFSNPYVQNSLINGLNTFLAENTYSLAIERGPVKAAMRASKTLLAVHERSTSSLYIGDGYIKTNEQFIITKTDKVVGDDRELEYGYGTINPESMIKVYGNVYWWDGLRGAVVQYTQAGLYPISRYGMENYFIKKAAAYFPYRNQVKVVSGFDYNAGELIFSFPEVRDGMGAVVVAAETWAFHLEDKVWLSRYSYSPDLFMSATGLKLAAFKSGQLWVFDEAATYNNFFGVQYQRSFKLVCNAMIGKDKRALNIHIKGDLCVNNTSEVFSPFRVYTPEGQESYTPAVYFDLDQGKWVASVLKNINTPGDFTGKLPVLSGDDIVSSYFIFEIINDRTDRAPCSQINFVFKTEEFSI